jgi:hypothetical protein
MKNPKIPETNAQLAWLFIKFVAGIILLGTVCRFIWTLIKVFGAYFDSWMGL